ncbi:hypothetical protein C8N46_109136 [Kordia periserrulae]|uniref:Outer membrane protein with beta-barrel domain n=1 Tax=Kordia periserrulae TaxID=701523 RepID=A0A2T6BUA5_9FLAO|nr:hypothetical protein [Kordia periserrulae]PTX59547.1 hypothetical protein C8N46_109136 [Kordia periserrulae]
MKLFSLLIACFFCVTIVYAQKIPESTFKKQLENKQKELYETVDKKEKLSKEIATLENEIIAEKDETKKKSKIEKKVALEKQEKATKEKIVTQCNDYREYRMFLKKHQDVSQEYLDKFKVRVCDFYTDATAENEKHADGVEKILKEKQQEIAKLEQEIFASDAEVATAKNNVNTTKNQIKIESAENNRVELKKKLANEENILERKIENNKKLIFKINSKCQDFSNYKKMLKEKYNVEDIILEAYKVPACTLYVQKSVASAEETNDAKKEIEKRIASIDAIVDLKKEIEQKVIAQAADVKKLEVEISLEKDEDKLEKLKEQLETAKKINRELVRKNDETLALIQSSCKEFKAYKKFLKKEKNIDAAVVDAYASEKCGLYAEEVKRDTKKFIIVGDNEPIKKEDLLSNENTQKVLADVFSIDSKTNLGTFEIPGDNEVINLYVDKEVVEKTDKLENFKNTKLNKEAPDKLITVETASDIVSSNYKEVPKKAIFKSIQIELLDGGIVDSRLILESLDGKIHFYFEGTDPVSLLNYSRRSPQRGAALKFSHYVSLNGDNIYNNQALEELRVRYTDVLDYHPNAGNNYVPDDVSYTFPSKEDDEEKTKKRRSYQIINNSHLQNVLDIRTYTDFIGLFGDEANGLFQIEGKADFFIHPFNFSKTSIYIFKKVSPYVRYSRLDKEDNFVEALPLPLPLPDSLNLDLYEFENRKLSILEKTNLEMGFNTNFFQFRFAKEIPFWISLYVPLSYHVTNVKRQVPEEETVDFDADELINFRTFGVGIGASIELKRLNNFGLNVGFEVKKYSNVGQYEKNNIIEPSKLETKAVNAEIFYYPNNNKSQSVFLRMRSIHDLGSSKDAFFQLQFGYRFTLGLGAVKAK